MEFGSRPLDPRLFGLLSPAEFLLSWHGALVVGAAVLLIAYSIGSRTRWGQARPLALCVVLSVCAHLLLIVYAYGAKFGSHGVGRFGVGAGETVVSIEWTTESAEGETEAADPEDRLPAPAEPEESPVEPPELAPAPEESPADEPSLESPEAEPAPEGPPELSSETPPETPPAAPSPLDASAQELADSAAAAADEVERAIGGAAVAAAAAAAVQARQESEPAARVERRPAPEIYRNRSAADRLGLVIQFGGSADTEAAVAAALQWLVANQAADGRWDADAHGAGREARILGQDRGGAGARADTGITGLAVLALLAGGQTHLEGEHREAIQHGLEFLLRSQKSDGDLAGDAEVFARMYCHGIAMLAISEAYAITGDQRIRPYVERAVAYTVGSQHPTTGGWRYHPGDTGDMSQFGWQLMALKSAEQAGFTIPPGTRSGMERFLESVTTGRRRGLASYRPREQASRTMTAEALLCRYFIGRPRDEQADEAAEYLLEEPPGRGPVNFYYWYYATLALHQRQGDAWKQWNDRLTARLLASQRRNGAQQGSWDPDPVWGNYGGRVFSTALGALCLESYYRYLPLSRVETAAR